MNMAIHKNQNGPDGKLFEGLIKRLAGSLHLYKQYFMIQLKSTMQYKTSFFLTALGQFLASFNVLLGMYFMFQRFRNVRAYGYGEVLLCCGILLMEFSLAETFARGFDQFSSIIGNGTFDRIMVRPRSSVLQVLGQRIEFTRLGRMVQAVIIFAYSLSVGTVDWSFSRIVVLIFMLLGGTTLFAGIFLIYAAICFFTLEGLEFMNVLTDGAREYGKYPFDIYGKKILLFATFVVPYACVQYYPLLFVLGQGKWWYGLLPGAGVVFLLPCYLLWRVGVRHYKSTGS